MARPQERLDADLVTEVCTRLLSLVPGSVRRDIERAARNPVGTVVDLVRLRGRSGDVPGRNGHAGADVPVFRVVVTVHAPARDVTGRLGSIVATVKSLDDERCRIEAWHRGSLDCLAQRLLMLGFEFEVNEPRELSTALRVLSARALRAARDDVDLIWGNS